MGLYTTVSTAIRTRDVTVHLPIELELWMIEPVFLLHERPLVDDHTEVGIDFGFIEISVRRWHLAWLLKRICHDDDMKSEESM